MKGLNSTIKSRLISTAVGVTIILITLGTVTNFNLQGTFKQYSLLSKIDQLNTQELKLRKFEKDFLLKETSNPEFYVKEESMLLDSFYSTLNNVERDIQMLNKNDVISNLGLYQKIKLVENGFSAYRKNFIKLQKQIIEKGFKDYGMVGKMRDQIHAVESIVEEQQNHLFSKYMLTLRRHEKDYLLRKDLKYRDKFDKVILDFTRVLNKKPSEDNKLIIEYLNNYQNLFHNVIEKDIIIGLKDDKGLMFAINKNTDQIEKNLAIIHDEIYYNSRSKISKAVFTLFFMIAVLSTAILVFLYRDSRYIVSSIKKLRQYIIRLGKGELPEEINVEKTDEISDMKKSINILTENLKHTRDFVIEVGNGNFDKEINVFDGKGELGSNLINMRKKLIQVASEREEQSVEAGRRMWANEGVSIFADILRNNSNDIELLAYSVTKKLVKYLKANQGGMFISGNTSNNKQIFDMVAAFAYDRKKYVKKQIKIGEGLIGMCAQEGETIYMTDIPNDYIEITSGLGGANPCSLLIVPLKREEQVLGMIEIASFKDLQPFEIEFVEKIAENLASHLYFVQMNIKTNKLLKETQRQAEEMSAQEEELRQNMEELTVTQERLASREEELLKEIDELKKENKEIAYKYSDMETSKVM